MSGGTGKVCHFSVRAIRNLIIAMGRAGVPWPLESYLAMTELQLKKWEESVGFVNEIVQEKIDEMLRKRRRK